MVVYFLSYRMKQIFLWLLWIVFGVLSLSVYAQTGVQWDQMARLYGLIDVLVQNTPDKAQIVLDTLDSYDRPDTSSAKKRIIVQIRTYIQAKLAQATAPVATPPAGYPTIPGDQLEWVLDVLHMEWDESAPIVVMEFLDFQCPYCKRQNDNKVLDELRDVEFPGKVRTAAAMFPLTGKRHELAQVAAESAECAHIQWGIDTYMAHKSGLYARGLLPTMNIIRRVAADNGLDADRLQACVDEWYGTAWVAAQKNLGIALWVRGTPGSVILDTRSGAYKTIRGAVPIEVFMDEIEFLYKSVQ